MRPTIGIAAALFSTCLVAGPALASQLRDALAGVPAAQLMARAPFAAYVLDHRAFIGAAHNAQADERMKWIRIVGLPRTLALPLADAATWRKATGLITGEPSAWVSFEAAGGQPGSASLVTLWRFGTNRQVDAFLDGLTQRGFAKTSDGGWANGDTSKSFDPKAIDRTSPFRSDLGRASVLYRSGPAVIQAFEPALGKAVAAVDGASSLASSPLVAASLDAVERSTGDATIVQTFVISHYLWFAGSPVFDRMVADTVDGVLGPDGQPKRLAPPPEPSPGAPATLGTIVADIEKPSEKRRGLLIALPYGECGQARTAGERFTAQWNGAVLKGGKTLASITGAHPETTLVEGKGACTCVITLLAPFPTGKAAAFSNPVMNATLTAMWSAQFPPFHGGYIGKAAAP